MWRYALLKANQEAHDLEAFDALSYIFRINNVNPSEFGHSLKKVLTKSHKKINSLRIVGCPNSGKTLLANCIVAPFICCYSNNHGSENEFFISNFLNKAAILCEELYITIATAEDFKSILAGQPIDVAKKFSEKQLLSRTPCIITSNYEKFGRGHLSQTDENALKIRCENFRFNTPIDKELYTIEWQQLYLFLFMSMQ